jgi:hypothetical protein
MPAPVPAQQDDDEIAEEGELEQHEHSEQHHARHSSVDMGLLDRQLHGGSSASSSQHGRPNPQQAPQQQPQQPAVLLCEPVTSSDHWRTNSSSPAVLPSAPQAPAGREGQARPGVAGQPQQQQHVEQGEAGLEGVPQQELGGPGSSDGGGKDPRSGEQTRSPAGTDRSPAGEC